MKIGLFGLFGCGNSGNDASLEAMLLFLRVACPDADLTCICPNPDVIQRDYEIAAIGNSVGAFDSSAARMLDALLLNFPRRIMNLLHALRVARRFDVLLVPGTGFLDDFSDTPFGWPFSVLKWLGGARLAGRKVLLVSIGAGPIRHPLSRFFMKTAARMATYRSYRDDASKVFMTKLGLDTRGDDVYPDLAFSLSAPAREKRRAKAPLTVGLGVMSYFGWAPAGDGGVSIYRPYLAKLDQFVSWLLDQGFNVRLLTGDGNDWKAVEDLKKEMAASHPNRVLPEGRVVAVRGRTLQDLMTEIVQTDVTVVTRYHNLVCSLKLGKPVISLEYSVKNHALMVGFGLAEFCQHVETFDLDLLKKQFASLLKRRAALAEHISAQDAELRRRLAVQECVLLGIIGVKTRRPREVEEATS